MLMLAELRAGEVLFDLGAGDGRAVIMAVLRKGAVHIYRITAVDDSGWESPPAVVRAPA